ncbi:hypothetical protein CCP3SC15_2150008 [Gammaproteobacteria bacterium]
MNAQETLIKYGSELKEKSNTELKNWTPQEIMGKAMIDGICYYRTPAYRMVCNLSKSGKVITITETKIYEVNDIANGKVTARIVKETETVLTVTL